MSKEIEKIIVKFLLKEANFDELQQLENWIKDPRNETLFLDYIKTNSFINSVMSKYDKSRAKNNILGRIRIEKQARHVHKKPWFKYAAAASIAILISAGFWFSNKGSIIDPMDQTPIIVNNQIETGTDKATLTLETGEQVALTKGDIYQTQNATSNGEEIIYDSSSTSQELVYNHLTIPRGGQFSLTLSDGSKVWLNSESQLKYPVAFNKGRTRQVELVYGEAYFDVSSSTNHNGSDFKVYHKNQEVQVLGTEFNIKAYKNEANIYTTLVEGKVSITAGNNSEVLAPSQQSNLNISDYSISVSTVSVREHVSWKEGLYMFKDKSLKDIMKTLSRWYDMDVVFEDSTLESIPFNGALYKDQSIINVLNDIKNFGVIKNYEINNKTITLK